MNRANIDIIIMENRLKMAVLKVASKIPREKSKSVHDVADELKADVHDVIEIVTELYDDKLVEFSNTETMDVNEYNLGAITYKGKSALKAWEGELAAHESPIYKRWVFWERVMHIIAWLIVIYQFFSR